MSTQPLQPLQPLVLASALANAFLMTHEDAQKLVSIELRRHGWEPCAGTAIATKEFQTAVGLRLAHIYLADYGNSYVLQGDYFSEGRNVLESLNTIFAAASSEAQVRSLAIEFARQVERTVGQAARLGADGWRAPSTVPLFMRQAQAAAAATGSSAGAVGADETVETVASDEDANPEVRGRMRAG